MAMVNMVRSGGITERITTGGAKTSLGVNKSLDAYGVDAVLTKPLLVVAAGVRAELMRSVGGDELLLTPRA